MLSWVVRRCLAWTVETRGDLAVDLPLLVATPEEIEVEVWAGLGNGDGGGNVFVVVQGPGGVGMEDFNFK